MKFLHRVVISISVITGAHGYNYFYTVLYADLNIATRLREYILIFAVLRDKINHSEKCITKVRELLATH